MFYLYTSDLGETPNRFRYRWEYLDSRDRAHYGDIGPIPEGFFHFRHPPPLVTADDAVVGIRARQREDGSLTCIPEPILEHLGPPRELTLAPSLSLNLKRHAGLGLYAATPGWLQPFYRHDLPVGERGAFSFLDESLREQFLQSAGDDRISVIRFQNLFRGDFRFASARVRAETVVDSSCVFAYRTQVEVLAEGEDGFFTFHERPFVALGMFETLNKVFRYERAKQALPVFFQALTEEDGAGILNPEVLETQIRERAGASTRYWTHAAQLFPWQSLQPIEETHAAVPTTRPLLWAGSAKRKVQVISEIGTAQAQIQTLSQQINHAQSRIQSHRLRIHDIDDEVIRYRTEIQKMLVEQRGIPAIVETLKAKRESLTETLEDVQSDLREKQLREQAQLEEMLQQEPRDWIAAWGRRGVILENIEYIDGDSTLHSYLVDPTVAERSLVDPQIRLWSLQFSTQAPVVIQVDQDSDSPREVVGGPYRVRVSRQSVEPNPKLQVNLNNSSGCFGISRRRRETKVWIHPHTPELSPPMDNWKSFWDFLICNGTIGCLGEAQPQLIRAFRNNDPRQVLIAAYSWLTSANSSDQWGRHYTHFPTPEQVRLPQPETTNAV